MKTFFKTQVLNSTYDAANRLAMDIIRYSEQMMAYRENLYIALSGGNTPQIMFSIIANEFAQAIDWRRLNFFWVDERCVSFESDESNFGIADRLLFEKLNIPRGNLHPMHGFEDPVNEVVRYSGEILSIVPCADKFPVFDLIILGMGNDGHTASIFPGQLNLMETTSICAVSEHPDTKQKRITLTGKVINNALDVVFLVTGASKTNKLKEIFYNNPESLVYPAKHIKPTHGNLSWYLDKDAASLIEDKL